MIRRMLPNGTLERVGLSRQPGVAGMGCTTCSGGAPGMGAAPAMGRVSRQQLVALAAGAATGSRAAKYAVEGARRAYGAHDYFTAQNGPRMPSGAYGMGDSSTVQGITDNGDGTVTLLLSDGSTMSGAAGVWNIGDSTGIEAGALAPPPPVPPITPSTTPPQTAAGWTALYQAQDGVWVNAQGIASDGSIHVGRLGAAPTAPTPPSSSIGSVFSGLFASAPALSTTGINAYRQFTGQAPVVQTKPVVSAGPSAGTVLAVLAVIAVIGLGVGGVVLATRGRGASRPASTTTTAMANVHRARRARRNRELVNARHARRARARSNWGRPRKAA
jgi:hypothetical protein